MFFVSISTIIIIIIVVVIASLLRSGHGAGALGDAGLDAPHAGPLFFGSAAPAYGPAAPSAGRRVASRDGRLDERPAHDLHARAVAGVRQPKLTGGPADRQTGAGHGGGGLSAHPSKAVQKAGLQTNQKFPTHAVAHFTSAHQYAASLDALAFVHGG